jgi:putative SOS response-associated peptidase YedK
MCGRFTHMLSWAEVVDYSELWTAAKAKAEDRGGGGGDEEVTQSPMRFANVVYLDRKTGERLSVPMRWGWPDILNPDPRAKPRNMHAKAETIDRLPTFAETFAKRRGIIFASSFNVGEELPNGKIKQWTLTRPKGQPMTLAVIWDAFRVEDQEDGLQELLAYALVTVAANPLIAPLTDRMPAIIDPDNIPLWLGEDRAPLSEVKAACQPFAGDLILTAPNPPKPPKVKKEQAPKRQKATEPTLF